MRTTIVLFLTSSLILTASAAQAQAPGMRLVVYDRSGAAVGAVKAPDALLEPDMREYMTLCRAGDSGGIARMVEAGFVQPIASGTPCIVLGTELDAALGSATRVTIPGVFPYKFWVRTQDLAVPRVKAPKPRRFR